MMQTSTTIAPTPKAELYHEGSSRLVHFRSTKSATDGRPSRPLLLVPSLINRWYILDLRVGFSVAEALVERGIDTYCLDWGIAQDEDRYVRWEDLFARIDRAVRTLQRSSGFSKIGVLGYCMGSTLTGIYTALHPDKVAALVNLAGPFDFDKAGMLRDLVDASIFDADAIAKAGNVNPTQMQMGFITLRPTIQLSKWITLFDRGDKPEFRSAFDALETWSNDNIPFPGAAYKTYIQELYQKNRIVKGEHYVGERRVDLSNIRCPLLTITADRDTICPPDAATALNELCGSEDNEVLCLKGGHVGTVVGKNAPTELYPALASWLMKRLGISEETRN